MFDMRYHIASLVAVFLALTVGLLLGSLIVDKGLLANQQERLLDSIRADVDTINQKNQLLETELSRLRAFEKEVLPIAVKDRLSESSVTVVTLTDGQEDQVQGIRKVLAQAGARTSHLHIKMKELDLSPAGRGERLELIMGEWGVSGGELERRFWSRIATEMSGSEPAELLGGLFDAGLAVAESLPPMDTLVVLAADDRAVGSRDILFLESFGEIEGVRVVAVEAAGAKSSRVAAYKLRNVSTIDNIDTVQGQISLVYQLTEREVAADKPAP